MKMKHNDGNSPVERDVEGEVRIELVGRIKGTEDFRIQSSQDVIELGTGEENDIQFLSRFDISSRIRIFRKGEEYFVRNMHPASTVFLNGDPIEEAVIDDGDGIRIGERTVLFSYISRTSESGEMEIDFTVVPGKTSTRTIIFSILFCIFFLLCASIVLLLVTTNKQDSIIILRNYWGYSTEGPILFSPHASDVDQDHSLEIIFQSDDGFLYILDALTGDPESIVDLGGKPSMPVSIRDLDGDATVEIVAGVHGRGIIAVSAKSGSVIWESAFDFGTERRTSPGFTDLDGDGILDIITISGEKKPVAISGKSGRNIPFSLPAGYEEVSHVTCMGIDISGDGRDDFFCTGTRGIFAVDGQGNPPFWTVEITPYEKVFPMVVRSGEGREVVVFESADGRLSGVDLRDGAGIWEVSLSGNSSADFGLGDIDLDGTEECLITITCGMIQVFDPGTGRLERTFDCWPDGSISTPRIRDLNRDGIMDLITVRNGSCISIVDGKRGEEIICWPCSGEVAVTPMVIDLNRDGLQELVFGSANGALYLFTAITKDRSDEG